MLTCDEENKCLVLCTVNTVALHANLPQTSSFHARFENFKMAAGGDGPVTAAVIDALASEYLSQ